MRQYFAGEPPKRQQSPALTRVYLLFGPAMRHLSPFCIVSRAAGVAKLRAQFGLEEDSQSDAAVLGALDKVREGRSERRWYGSTAWMGVVAFPCWEMMNFASLLQVEKSTGALLLSNEAGLETLRKELQQVRGALLSVASTLCPKLALVSQLNCALFRPSSLPSRPSGSTSR